MRKYLRVFKIETSKSLVYRGELVVLVINHILSFAAVVVLWLAVFQENENVAGFSFQITVFYYLAVLFTGFFTEVFLAEEVARYIREGNIANFLLKPLSYIYRNLFYKLATKFNYLLLTLPTFLLFLAFLYFTNILDWWEVLNFKSFIIACMFLIFGWLLNFLIEVFLGYLAFWFHEIWSLKHLKWIALIIFSGQSFPLEFLPPNILPIFELIPLRFIYHTPSVYLINQRSMEHVIYDFVYLIFWIIVLYIVCIFLWKKGVKKYEAYGS